MPTLDPVNNFAVSSVATAPSPPSSGTSLVLAAGDGALFPDPASVGAYNIIIHPDGALPSTANAEIVRVTARSTDTLTITRTQEGTSARTVLVGDTVGLQWTGKFRDDLETHIVATAVHGATGAVVGTTNTQTLTNKTIQLENAVYYQAKEAGGTLRNMIGLDASDQILIGNGQQVLGYAAVTADQGSITTLVDLTGLSVAVTVPVLLGRRIIITGYAPQFYSSVADDRLAFFIREGSTTLGSEYATVGPATGSYGRGGHVMAVIQPSAGAHTYKLSAQRDVGTGNVTMASGSGYPAFIMVQCI